MTKQLVRCRTIDKGAFMGSHKRDPARTTFDHLTEVRPIKPAEDINALHEAFWAKLRR
ncbi:hypothetical protein [Paraburkholderia sp. ZP32-5]|uniref:hypothetical protein n=1 Tax=Paraburkholderia sp. ZP32-5 TaxID=2883245 RepID=UPI001F3144BD|nr:hypothetical protein [Paraburkholderia sp. ZP32-5]